VPKCPRHFGTGVSALGSNAKVSRIFMVVPKCPMDTSAPVPSRNVLGPKCLGQKCLYTMATYGCIATGQSVWPQALAGAKALSQLCLWWQRHLICDNFVAYKWTLLYLCNACTAVVMSNRLWTLETSVCEFVSRPILETNIFSEFYNFVTFATKARRLVILKVSFCIFQKCYTFQLSR